MKLVKLALTGIALAISTSSFAVDGYKNWKFGMSEKEAKKAYKCEWYKDDVFLSCDNFTFAEVNTGIGLLFIEKKLENIVIPLPPEIAAGTFNKLADKYKIISRPTTQELKAQTPNIPFDFVFDDGSITLRAMFDGNANESDMLIYGKDYQNNYFKLQNHKIDDDL